MEDINSESGILTSDDDLLTEEALSSMRSNLPPYVVNCLVATGYDTLPVIAEMDVSDDLSNIFKEVEDFINSEFPGDPKFRRDANTANKFQIPPGHRKRIAKFVNEAVESLGSKRCTKKNRKGSTPNPLPPRSVHPMPQS